MNETPVDTGADVTVTEEGLIRVMGTRALSMGIVNMIIGAGIFVLPGLIAQLLGPAAIIAYLVCSVAVALVFLCLAEAGSRVSRSGGTYAYIEDAFGPFAGFLASILLWFGWGLLSNAAVAIALVEVVAFAFPVFDAMLPRSLFLIVLFASLAAINIRGASWGVRFSVFNTYAKLVPLAALVIFGAFAVQWDNLVIMEMPSLSSIGAGTLMLVFAFGGGEIALNAGGEVKNPSRTVPLALLFGIGIVFVMYVAIQGVAQGIMGPELAVNLEAPLIATAERAFGPWGRTFMLIGAGISILGVTSGHVLNHPRAVFASARDGLLPAKLAEVHPRYRTPHMAIIFCVTITCAIAMTGAFKTLAIVSSGSLLVLYFGCSLAVLKLRRMDKTPKPGVFVIPGGPTVPIASALVVAWLLSNMTGAEAIGLGALLGVASVGYFLVAARRRTK
ncbi:MAG: APA family basic amino acid/polyamine antiporter [Rhodothermales bacterium]|jgi:APA family basic amino acid/polyamine antiporter